MTRTALSLRQGVFALVAALAFAATAPALAQDSPLKIAVIDVEKVLLDSNRGKELIGTLDAMKNDKTKEGEALGKSAADLRQRLEDGKLSLAEDRLIEMQKELEDKLIALRRFQEEANRELAKKREEIFSTVEGEVLPIIQAVGNEMGATLIFNKFGSGLVYADESIDITGTVIERYNNRPASGS